MFMNVDKYCLTAFYDREHLQTYLLQKNKFEDHNKLYLRVMDAKSLKMAPGSVGNTQVHADLAPKFIRTQILVAYPQGDEDWCLFLCLASGLHYMGLTEEAAKLAGLASKAEHLPGTRGIDALKAAMLECAPSIGHPQVSNNRKRKQKKSLTVEDMTSILTKYPTVVIPLGIDGSVNHAICVVNDLIFDATQWCALKCKVESMSWICDSGTKGVAGVYEALRFQNPMNCKPLEIEIVKNWIT
jgi:hypothetical protein